jgi:hypothetical protein
MNIHDLFHDFNIHTAPEGHKHYREGWVNVECPFCAGNPGYHLGYDLELGYFKCWRCGWHQKVKTLSKLLNKSVGQTIEIIHSYGGTQYSSLLKPKIRIRRKAHRLPSNVGPLSKSHRQYLINRGFNPDKLISEWGISGTGPISMLDGINYKHRIVIPISWNGERVSFQTRDITGKAKLKYISCPRDREIIHHKHILYGDQSKWGDTCICVEGATDVWRVGKCAVAVFGIEYTHEQVRLLYQSFRRVIIMFDNDPQATEQAHKLRSRLRFLGTSSAIERITGDPAELSKNNVHDIIRKWYNVGITV